MLHYPKKLWKSPENTFKALCLQSALSLPANTDVLLFVSHVSKRTNRRCPAEGDVTASGLHLCDIP